MKGLPLERQTGTGAVYFHALLIWPLRHPKLAVGMLLVAAAAAIVSMARLHADTSVEAMFAQNDPSAIALSHVLNDFPAADQLLVLVSMPRDAQVDPQRLLVFGQRFIETVHQLSEVEKLTDGIFFQADEESRSFFQKVIGPSALFYLNDETFEAARSRLSTTEIHRQIAQDKTLLATPGPAAAAMAKMVAQDPLRLHEFILDRLAGQRPFRTYENGDVFISPDGHDLLIRVIGAKPPNDLSFSRALTEGIARAATLANTDGLRVQLTGAYAIATQSERSIRRDMIGSVIGAVVLLQLLFIIAYRSPIHLFALAFGPVAVGIVLGFGAYAFISPVVTPISAALGAILAGMGIDYSIQHIAFYERRRGGGATPEEAARDVALDISPAVLAGWATSLLGFLAIAHSPVKALHDFAILGALGLTGAFICVVMVLPPLLMLSDRRSTARSRIRFSTLSLLEWLGRKRRLWMSLSLLILCLSALLLVRGGQPLPFESNLAVMHPRPNPAMDAQAEIARRFGISSDSLTVYLKADSPLELVTLAYEVDERLRKLGGRISGTYGLPTLLPDPRLLRSRRHALSDDDVQRVMRDLRSALEENGFATKAFEGYEQFLQTLLTQKNPPTITDLVPYRRMAETVLPASAFAGKAPTEAISLIFVNNSSADSNTSDLLIEDAREALRGLPGAMITGLSVAGHGAQRTVRHELPRFILVAGALVVLYLIIHFRNPLDALLALLPAIFGIVVGAAILRLTGQKLNMVNLVAVPLLIGIDVDYGIFLVNLARIRRIRAVGVEKLAQIIEPSMHAVIICAVATILGYVSLLWTSIPAEQSLGIAAAAGIGACLAGVLFLLVPTLFSLSRRA